MSRHRSPGGHRTAPASPTGRQRTASAPLAGDNREPSAHVTGTHVTGTHATGTHAKGTHAKGTHATGARRPVESVSAEHLAWAPPSLAHRDEGAGSDRPAAAPPDRAGTA